MANVNSKNITTSTTTNTNATGSTSDTSLGMDDGGSSRKRFNQEITSQDAKTIGSNSSDTFSDLYHSAGIYKRNEIDYFNKRYRFGVLNPYEALNSAKEYLFFTKPNLNIYAMDDNTLQVGSSLQEYLQTVPYFLDLADKHLDVIKCLQRSLNSQDPFNHLLENMCTSNLDVPSMSSDMIETPSNMYGVNYNYHGSSEASNDSYDFSLEFKDTKYLPVYNFFKAYEEYEIIKHHGQIKPPLYYIVNKILSDQYSIYKFIVDEDGETILYYGKYYGVKSKSLPRDVFSNTTFDNGISYTVDFNAAFFFDNRPEILNQFNNLTREYYNSRRYQIDIHNQILDRPDNRPAMAAYIVTEPSNLAPGGKVNKLKWRGDDKA